MDERVADLLRSRPELFLPRQTGLDQLDDAIVRINSTQPIGSFSLADRTDAIAHPQDNAQDDVLDTLENPDYFIPDTLGPLGELSDAIQRVVGTGWPGSLGTIDSKITIAPDSLAFYLPFHYFPSAWGIYLLAPGVVHVAQRLVSDVPGLSRLAALRIARAFLFHHEAYHSAVEGFATRAELITSEPFYKTSLQSIFGRRPIISPHEETLACLYAIKMVRQNIKPATDRDEICDALRRYLAACDPSYAAAASIAETALEHLQRDFAERAVQESSPKRIGLTGEAWRLGSFMFRTLLQRNRNYSWILQRRVFAKMSRLAVHYFRNKSVVQCLEKLVDARVIEGGRHSRKLKCPNGAQAGLQSGEIPIGTLGGMLRQLKTGLTVSKFREECSKINCPIS